MREIKFRGKDIVEKWRYGDLVQEKWKSLLNTNKKSFMIKKDKTAYTVLEETIGQFTGLKDKNGKEIYEGDIVSFNLKSDSEGQPYIIGYIEYQTTFSGYRIMSFEGIFALDYNIKDIEVIGNIYDNPELLEK